LHIAFVTTESPYGDASACGIAAYLRAIIPAIADAGHRVSVFANANEEKEFITENGRVKAYHFRLPSLHWYAAKIPLARRFAPLPLRQLEWSVALYRRVARASATAKIDVIESTEVGSLFLSRIAPLIIRLHGSERIFREYSALPLNPSVRWSDLLEGLSCNRAAAITAPSQFHANEIAKRRGWARERVHVISNPISTPLLKAASKFQRNGSNERIVLYTGRVAPVKGIETLIEAAKLVHRMDGSISFILAGPWQMPRPPEGYGLQTNGTSRNGIEWIGSQAQDALIDWYKRASLFVLPSNYESFGISVLEALVFGLPVVATKVSGAAEVMGTDCFTALVAPRDPRALAEKILGALNSQKRASAKAGVARMLERCHPDQVVAETLKLYAALQRNVGAK
jgi:glycogen(starch) synthase